MALLKKSLSEDSADRYSHTWAFLLLFLLSAITHFVTLSPSMLPTNTKPTINYGQNIFDNAKNKKANIKSEPPHYTASCWTPAQFTNGHVIYTNSVCAAALNSLLQGRNYSEADLYEQSSEMVPLISDPRPLTVEDFHQASKTTEDSDKEVKEQLSDKEKEEREKFQTQLKFLQHNQQKAQSDLQKLVIYKTPLYLFLLAICLRLPHAIWSFLSNCCGCINVNQTLASVQTSMATDVNCRQKLREDLVRSLGKSKRKGASLVYLLMKLLMAVVVCVEIIVVCHCLLVESDKLENDLDTVKIENEALVRAMREYKNKKYDTENQGSTPAQNTNYTDYAYMCSFKIRRLMELKSFKVQCLFSTDDGKARDESVKGNKRDNDDNGPKVSQSESIDEDGTLFMYKGLYTILLAMLITLAFLNISSLIMWLLKLFLSSCRPSLGLKADAAMDVVFLVSMAWNNTSAVVAMEIAKLFPWSETETDGQEGESYKLKQDPDNN